MQPVPDLSLLRVASESQFAKPGHKATQVISISDTTTAREEKKKSYSRPLPVEFWETDLLNEDMRPLEPFHTLYSG